MRKLLLALSMGAAMVSAPFASHAQQVGNGDLFINGSVGQAHSNVDLLTQKNDTGYGLNFGYRYNDTWGLEAGYVDLGKPSATGSYAGYDYKGNLHVAGWTVGGNGKFNFAQNWFLSARLGGFFSKTKLDATVAGESFSFRGHDTNFYAGVGAGYNFNRSWSLGINYDHYAAKADNILTKTNSLGLLSGTLEYRFGI
ncbi:porin family protein [Dyella solisilvae]|nr:outer membrane beta-barrel protein [Dyella solisilvae]